MVLWTHSGLLFLLTSLGNAALMQAEAADSARESEELRQQLGSDAQHADALAAAQTQVHDLKQHVSQLETAVQQENSRAQEALQVCPSALRFNGDRRMSFTLEGSHPDMVVKRMQMSFQQRTVQ